MVKNLPADAGDAGSIPGWGRSPGEGKCYPLQYSGLENSMDCIVHGVAKSQTWLSDFHFHFHFQYSCLENPLGRGDWRATVHGVAKSWTWMIDWAHTNSIRYLVGSGHPWLWYQSLLVIVFKIYTFTGEGNVVIHTWTKVIPQSPTFTELPKWSQHSKSFISSWIIAKKGFFFCLFLFLKIAVGYSM